jgi:SAM-dependent methyltransferase
VSDDGSGWEAHARWWIDGFTGGVDAEYEEQIIPLATEELTGFARVLDVGCGDGQISRAAAAAEGGGRRPGPVCVRARTRAMS